MFLISEFSLYLYRDHLVAEHVPQEPGDMLMSYLPKQFYDIIVAPYLKHCFYYGKDVAEDCGAQVGHQYEER